jgi:hypothetical protein
MNDPILPLPGLSPAGGKPVVIKFDGGLLSSGGGVLALREVERRLRVADRLAACVVDPRRAGPDHPQPGRHHSFSTADDCGRLRRRQRRLASSRRPGVQDGDGSDAVRARAVLAVDDLSAGEPAGRSRAAADGPRHGRSLLRVVPRGSQADHARHRRHVRCRLRRPATAAVQRPLRRIRISADRRVRRRRTLRPPSSAPPSGPAARRSEPFCAGCCAPSAPTGRTPKSCCAPTATIAARRSSTGVGPTASTTSSASRRPRRCAGTLKGSRPARSHMRPCGRICP